MEINNTLDTGSKKLDSEKYDMKQLENHLFKLENIQARINEDISDWFQVIESINGSGITVTDEKEKTSIKEDILEDLAYRLGNDTRLKYIKELLNFIIYNKIDDINNQPKPKMGSLSLNDIFNKEDIGLPIIAGPCAIESIHQMKAVGKKLNELGIKFLRGGAFKPRTSPNNFQGYGFSSLGILRKIGDEFGLKTVSEVVDTRNVEAMEEYIDIFQIGSRNMFNYELLKEVGKSKKPVILKRGLMATVNEYIGASEYIRLGGNHNIILCERGIRTFDSVTRNTLDIASVPILKKETGLPVIVDLSHSLGDRKDMVEPIAKACLLAGADSLMVEVHPNPKVALSDSKQQLNFSELEFLVKSISEIISK